jgi:N-acyl-D-amino-acid deacylase
MPPWVQEGSEAWRARLRIPTFVSASSTMTTDTNEWENMFLLAGPDNMRLLAFKTNACGHRRKTLAEVALERQTTPARAAMDLVVEDGTSSRRRTSMPRRTSAPGRCRG